MDSEDIDMIPTDDLAPHQDADGDDFWGNSGIKDDTDAKEVLLLHVFSRLLRNCRS